jgi:fermentation-respiration switch protein FrsA (DUF1100 family)
MAVFPATRDIYRDPSAFGWDFEEVWLEVDRGRSHAWHIPLEGARATVLFSHGNAGNMADRLESISLLRGLGFSVLAYDYGGYGRSTGRPSEQRCYADIRAAWRYLTEGRGIAPSQIVLFGRSLGGAVTCELAAEVQPAAVVLESTFTSIPDVAGDLLPFLPARLLVRARFTNLDKVGRFRSPLLYVHSRDDTLIPFHHGEKLFAAAREPKTFLEIRGDHNEGFVVSMEPYLAGWRAFLDPILPWIGQPTE